MARKAHFERVGGIDQKHVKRDHTEKGILLVANFTEGILMAGSITEIYCFSYKIFRIFKGIIYLLITD